MRNRRPREREAAVLIGWGYRFCRDPACGMPLCPECGGCLQRGARPRLFVCECGYGCEVMWSPGFFRQDGERRG